MAQREVHANPVVHARDERPHLAVLRSDLQRALPTRLVAPLARGTVPARALPQRLAPVFEIEGPRGLMKPHDLGVKGAGALDRPLAPLRRQAHLLIDALGAALGAA